MVAGYWTVAQYALGCPPMARMTPADRRSAIVDAALAVAQRKGLAATTVRDVAHEMGTSSGLIHHYFDSMDQVLAAAFEQVAGDDLAQTELLLDAEGHGDPTSLIRAFLASYAPVGDDWAFQLWLDAWAEAGRRPILREASSRLNLAWAALLERAIRAGVADGSFRCPDPSAAAWRILSLIDGLALQVVAHQTIVERRDMLEWAATAAERELGLRAGTLHVGEAHGRRPAVATRPRA
jgi:AcrR family transcriptional regulator